MQENDFVTNWINQVKEGDEDAADQIWNRYYSQLVAMARQRLGGASVAVSDEEDIAVSVFESFYRAAENGRFPDLNCRDDLWRLLLRMAARKIIDLHRHNQRLVRGGDITRLSLSPHENEEDLFEVMGTEPSPEMVAMMTESCDQLLGHLEDKNLRDVAVGKLEGYSNAELATRFACSERTIERRLKLIRQKVNKELLTNRE